MPKYIWVLIPLVLASCAYLMGDQHKEILITTASGKPAYCTLKNKAGTWRGYSGKPINIAKVADGNLKISCAMNNYRASKTIKPDSKNKYPDYVMVNMRPRKVAANGAEAVEDNDSEAMSPKDNDDESTNSHGDDGQDNSSRPLNILPDSPEDPADDVVIIKHK